MSKKLTDEEKESQRRMVCEYVRAALPHSKPALIQVPSKQDQKAMKDAIYQEFNGAWPINCRVVVTGGDDNDGPNIPRPA